MNNNKGGNIIAARHGERLDYILRDSGSNWIPRTSRPWDPPLSDHGRTTQVVELGRRIAKKLKEKGLPKVSVVYSSPLLRCCQTARGAIRGLQQEDHDDDDKKEELKVKIEHGLIESVCEKWYTSWSLPTSDSTWGYRPPFPDKQETTIHPMAQLPITNLLLSPSQMQDTLNTEVEFQDDDDMLNIIDTTYTSIYTLDSYQWNNFESRKLQLQRMKQMSTLLAAKHPNETILLVAHGSPVTHLYEVITGKDWSHHGVSGYASFSIYGHAASFEEMKKEETCEKSEEKEDCGVVVDNKLSFSWTEIEINNSTHTLDESSAEFKSGR